MKRALLLLLLLGACVDRAVAQDTTAAMLQRARELYERLELERALPLLRDIVSPGWAFDVTAGQRVEANLYLGATLVLLGSRDSAITHFRAALDRDPFADLDAARFTPAQLDAFQAARRTLFRIGIRSVAATRLDPRSGKLTFTVVTTHAATGRFEIRAAEPATSFVLFAGDINGLRELEWDGVLANGQLAPSGRYAVVLLAQSRLRGGSDSTRAYFDVQQEFPSLEDTVPDLQPGQLLPERYRRSTAAADLLKGVGIAAGAFLLADVASNRNLGRSRGMAAVVGVTGIAAGVANLVTGRGRGRAENIAINERRRSERTSMNQQIRQRNAARRAQTILVIAPAAGTAH